MPDGEEELDLMFAIGDPAAFLDPGEEEPLLDGEEPLDLLPDGEEGLERLDV